MTSSIIHIRTTFCLPKIETGRRLMSLLILSSSRSSTHHRKMSFSGTIVAHTSNRRTLIRMRMRIMTAPETSDGRALTLETHNLWRLSLTTIIIHPGTKSLITLRLGILTPTGTTIKTRRSHWPLAKPTRTSRNSMHGEH